jgi:hypothetical protein
MPELKASAADLHLHTLRRVHKTALGFAVGVMTGGGLSLLTAIHVALAVDGPNLELLNQYFAGYRVSWPGAFIGLGWGAAVGFIGGWLLGFVHNFTMSFWVFIVRTRNDLSRTRNFLDHL